MLNFMRALCVVVAAVFGTSKAWAATVGPVEVKTTLTDREFLELARVVYAEALSEGRAGQAAVAAVAMNRRAYPGFPKTMVGVLHQKNAFSCRLDGGSRLYRKACGFDLKSADPEWQAVLGAIRKVQRDGIPESLKASTFYREVSCHDGQATFAKLKLTLRIAKHNFYAEPVNL